jgi:hypothetical protein
MNEKYFLAAYAPIFDEILPIAMAAIERISGSGSVNAVFIPGPTNLRYGSISDGFNISSEILPMTWQAPYLS